MSDNRETKFKAGDIIKGNMGVVGGHNIWMLICTSGGRDDVWITRNIKNLNEMCIWHVNYMRRFM